MVGESLSKEILDDLTFELFRDSGFDALILKPKVDNALKEVLRARKYPMSYSEEQINSDLSNYYSNIRSIALYDYNIVGAEFQQSHSENGISRIFGSREKLFNGIIPIARF